MCVVVTFKKFSPTAGKDFAGNSRKRKKPGHRKYCRFVSSFAKSQQNVDNLKYGCLLLFQILSISAPNPSSTGDKSRLGGDPGDGSMDPLTDKGFYENLPFHGMQNPPNKVSNQRIFFVV